MRIAIDKWDAHAQIKFVKQTEFIVSSSILAYMLNLLSILCTKTI